MCIATKTTPSCTTIAEVCDDWESTLLKTISAFGDSTSAFFILEPKTFDKTAFTPHKFYEGHDSTIRSASRALITEILFIKCLEIMFLPRNGELRPKSADEGLTILVLDGHSTDMTRCAIAPPTKNHFLGGNIKIGLDPIGKN
jgi:hypothetical protein